MNLRILFLRHKKILGTMVVLSLAFLLAGAVRYYGNPAFPPDSTAAKGLSLGIILVSVMAIFLTDIGFNLFLPFVRFFARAGDRVYAMWPTDPEGKEMPTKGRIEAIVFAQVKLPSNIWGLFLKMDGKDNGQQWCAIISLDQGGKVTVPFRHVFY